MEILEQYEMMKTTNEYLMDELDNSRKIKFVNIIFKKSLKVLKNNTRSLMFNRFIINSNKEYYLYNIASRTIDKNIKYNLLLESIYELYLKNNIISNNVDHIKFVSIVGLLMKCHQEEMDYYAEKINEYENKKKNIPYNYPLMYNNYYLKLSVFLEDKINLSFEDDISKKRLKNQSIRLIKK